MDKLTKEDRILVTSCAKKEWVAMRPWNKFPNNNNGRLAVALDCFNALDCRTSFNATTICHKCHPITKTCHPV